MAGRVVRVGIAGQGRSGYDIHARWLREAPGQYRIVAVADEMTERRREAVEAFDCRAYRTWQELVRDDEVELFVNSLPSRLHPKATIAALKAGHDVVCEKPLAVKVKDFDRMVSAARKAGKLFAPFQNSRFYPFFRKIQEVIGSGKLGRIVHVRSAWGGFSRRWDWQTRQELWGGNLNNTGPHPMDHAVMLFGEKTPKVFCRMKSEEGSLGDADDFCTVTLFGGLADPVVEVLVSSYNAYPPGDIYNINGTRGGLAGGPGGLRWRFFDPKKAPKQRLLKGWSDHRRYCKEELPWVEETWTPPPTDLDGFQQNSKAFYDNVHDVLMGKGKLVVTPVQVRRQIAVIEECHRQNRLPRMRTSRKR
ncbi:MAG TPA: Gfo/Idh/MocA family oxidoreductase [Planctomycetota bacterium]|nr:Gfo/Idh/MocA family oxidoreductase [Planctomycetota bacterium]